MNKAPQAPSADEPEQPADVTGGLALRMPWIAFLLPFLVYVGIGSFEPAPQTPNRDKLNASQQDQPEEEKAFDSYSLIYTIKIAATIVALSIAWPAYQQFRFKLSSWSLVVGIVGAGVWIYLSELGVEKQLVKLLGEDSFWVKNLGLSPRPALDAWALFDDNRLRAVGLLAIRFIGLAVVVPIVEEMFLRGWLMRYIQSARWWTLPIGYASPAAIAAGTLVPMLYHPEKLASLVWFSMVTLLMLRTKNIWDCVAAHIATNLLLGIYVVRYAKWELW